MLSKERHQTATGPDRVGKLCENLQREQDRAPAVEVLRSLIEQVTLMPDNAELAIILRGDPGAILRFAADKKTPTSFQRQKHQTTCYRKDRWQQGGRNRRSLRASTQNAKTSAAKPAEASQVSLVAGVGFEPTTFRL